MALCIIDRGAAKMELAGGKSINLVFIEG